jgi:hypothetical protein
MIEMKFDTGEVKELEVKKLNLKQGDILVFSTKDDIHDSRVEENLTMIATSLKAYLGYSIYVMALQEGLTVDTVISDPKIKSVFCGFAT